MTKVTTTTANNTISEEDMLLPHLIAASASVTSAQLVRAANARANAQTRMTLQQVILSLSVMEQRGIVKINKGSGVPHYSFVPEKVETLSPPLQKLYMAMAPKASKAKASKAISKQALLNIQAS
jgi:hypothetical protein